MSRVVSNVRTGRGARIALRALLHAAVLAPLALVALPAGDLVDARARLERAASERTAARRSGAPAAEVEALERELARLTVKAEALGLGAPSSNGGLATLEARALVGLCAREHGLAVEEVGVSEGTLVVAANGRLSDWVATIDRLVELHLSPTVTAARFERAADGGFHGRVELTLGATRERGSGPEDAR